jgi:hypothetical protein
VNWLAFVERGLAGGEEPAEEVSRVLVSYVDHMGVHAQGRGGVGVAQSTGSRADLATGGDEHAGAEVAERVKGELRQPFSLAKPSEVLAEFRLLSCASKRAAYLAGVARETIGTDDTPAAATRQETGGSSYLTRDRVAL